MEDGNPNRFYLLKFGDVELVPEFIPFPFPADTAPAHRAGPVTRELDPHHQSERAAHGYQGDHPLPSPTSPPPAKGPLNFLSTVPDRREGHSPGMSFATQYICGISC